MASTRRDILAFILGAPLAAACSRGCTLRAPPLPDGELFDFGRVRAHDLLRGPGGGVRLPTTTTDTPTLRTQVAIVGGGMAGLTAAWRLKQLGIYDVQLFEIDDNLGGTSQSGSSPIAPFPWGAHYVVLPFADNPDFVTLLDEVGALDGTDEAGEPLAREEVACREPEERHFYQGMFHEGLYPRVGETDDEAAQMLRFQRELNRLAAFVDAGGRRAFTLPAARSAPSLVAELDGVTFAAWLDARGFTSWRLRWLCDYACRDDYGLSLGDVSAWAGLFYFCARRRPSVPEGDGEAIVDDRAVLTWPEGNGRLVAHLARAVEGKNTRGQAVVDVVPGESGVELLAVGDAGPVRVVADDVVVAAPRFVATRIVRPLREQRPTFADAFTTSPWAVVNVHLRERPKANGFPFAWDTVFTESRSLGYVTATHQMGRDHGPTVLTWYRPLVEGSPDEARQRLLSLDRAAWAEAALSELELGHPDIRDVVTRVDVGRFGHAMVRPVPGLFSSGSLEAARAPVGRVSFAHTDLSGLALCEEAFFHGVRAADEVVGRRSGR